jgi:hypothetical protein
MEETKGYLAVAWTTFMAIEANIKDTLDRMESPGPTGGDHRDYYTDTNIQQLKQHSPKKTVPSSHDTKEDSR